MAAAALVKSKGGPVPGYNQLSAQPQSAWVDNLEAAHRGGAKLGVAPVLEPRDVASPCVEYLGVMAWAAQFQWIPDKAGPAELVEMRLPSGGKCKVSTSYRFIHTHIYIIIT